MARINLKTVYPYVTWDPKTKRGTTNENLFITLELETAKSKAGLYPFRTAMHHEDGPWREAEFTNIDDALKDCNRRVEVLARACGWTPEGEK